MKHPTLDEVLKQILEKDPRYKADAYEFVRNALDYTVRMYNKPKEGVARHVTGKELLEGIRRCALQEFGPMARTVLERWGLHDSKDFGHIVFNLVESGVLGKTDEDRLEDFEGGFTFEDAFSQPFKPSQAPRASRKSRSAS